MRELNQHTARVLDKINDRGQPAVITKHGRIVAMVTPLRDAEVESCVLARGPLADELKARIDQSAENPSYTAAEMRDYVRDRDFTDD
jgi:prevent-host-death family protein